MKLWRRKAKGDTFHISVPATDVNGEPIRLASGAPKYRCVSLRTKDRRLAQKRATKILRGEDPFEDRRVRPDPAVPADAVSSDLARIQTEYLDACEHGSSVRRRLRAKSLKTDRATIKAFFTFLGRRHRHALGDVVARDVTDFLDTRLQSGDSPRTYNKRRSILSALFTWATRIGYWVDSRGEPRVNPVRMTVMKSASHDDGYEPERVRYFSREEMEKILDGLTQKATRDPRWRAVEAAVYLARFTGARRGEIPLIRCEDFDWERRILDAPTEKRKRRRVVEIHPALDRFRELWEDREGPVVRAPSRWSGDADTLAERLSVWFKKLLQELGLYEKAHSFHALRHTFASEAVLSGVPIDVVAKWLDHSSIELTHRFYSHLTPRASRGRGAPSVLWWPRVAAR